MKTKQKITNKQAVLLAVKVLAGVFVFLCTFSGMHMFSAIYKALPAILLAPLIFVIENENWASKFNIWRLLPILTSLVVITIVLVFVFVDIEVFNKFTQPHLNQNENWGVMLIVSLLALYSYISLCVWTPSSPLKDSTN